MRGRDKHVCTECISDDDLREVIETNLDSHKCDYCGKSSDDLIAAPLDVVTERIWECVSEVYVNPVEELPYETAEGGWQGADVYDPWQLLNEEIGLGVEDENLLEDIVGSSPEPEWTKRDWVLLEPNKRQAYGWEAFKRAVKHKRRFTFWTMEEATEDPHHPDYLPVSRMLDEIRDAVNTAELVKNLPAGSRFWRVRIHKTNVDLAHDHELCSPPAESATQPNRMSPGGIPMFYGSEDLDTAVDETFDPSRAEGKAITGACFAATRAMRILDLFDLPEPPGFFASGTHEIRETIKFLRQFARDLSQPIPRDGKEHIDYVPSQAFTEFVRYHMKAQNGESIDGIRYRSSRNGRPCIVLFCERENCIATEDWQRAERILRLEECSLQRFSEEQFREAVRRTTEMRRNRA